MLPVLVGISVIVYAAAFLVCSYFYLANGGKGVQPSQFLARYGIFMGVYSLITAVNLFVFPPLGDSPLYYVFTLVWFILFNMVGILGITAVITAAINPEYKALLGQGATDDAARNTLTAKHGKSFMSWVRAPK
jgi:hypothetical protein